MTSRLPKLPNRSVRSRSYSICGRGLSNLRGSLQGNDKLDQALFDAVSKTEELKKLEAEIGKTPEGDKHE